jgi:F0F1-type ATP synthase gamma subunit
MPPITQLKKEIRFNTQLGGLLDILKSIAAQQFQVLEETLRSNPPFFEAIQTIAETFDLGSISHPFTQGTGPVGVIAVTSDAGLLGGLNQQVVTMAVREYRSQPGELMVVGKRGISYVQEYGFSCQGFPGVQDETRRVLAERMRDYALNRVLEGRLGSLTIVYPRALSFTVQRVESIRALPCQAWLQAPHAARGVRGDLLFMESPVASTLEYLVWIWLGEKLYEVFGFSRLAELAARAVHLEGSSQELQRRRDKLRHRYFRERHEVIDRSMRELFAARSLYRSS